MSIIFAIHALVCITRILSKILIIVPTICKYSCVFGKAISNALIQYLAEKIEEKSARGTLGMSVGSVLSPIERLLAGDLQYKMEYRYPVLKAAASPLEICQRLKVSSSY